MEYFRNSMGPAERCLRDSGIDKRNVHDVVLVICTEADQASRRSHSSGVLITSCGTKLDRSVLTVGYGKTLAPITGR